MRGGETNRLATDADLDPNHTAPFSLPLVFILTMINRADRKSRENSDPVLSTLVVEIMSKSIVHGCHPCEFSDFILALGAFHTPIDLLQSDQVGMLIVDYVSDAL